MKKQLLTIFFAFLGFTSTFASFPITENINTVEILEEDITTINSPINETPMGSWSLLMGLAWLPLLMIGVAIIIEGDGEFGYGLSELGIVVMIAGAVSYIGAIITGIRSLRKGETPKWKAYVGLALTAGWIILGILSGIMEGISEYTY